MSSVLSQYLKRAGDSIALADYNSLFDAFYDQVEGPPDGTGVPNSNILDRANIPFTAIDTSSDVLRFSDQLQQYYPYHPNPTWGTIAGTFVTPNPISWAELFWDFESGLGSAITVWPMEDWVADPVVYMRLARDGQILTTLSETIVATGGPTVVPERNVLALAFEIIKGDELLIYNKSALRALVTMEFTRVSI